MVSYLGLNPDDITFIPDNYIDGLELSNNATQPNDDIDIAPGVCTSRTNNAVLELTSTLTKQIDVDWVAGNNAGGLASALTLTNDTWYHVYLLKNLSSGQIDAGFDTSIIATNLLADATGYTAFRRLGSIRRGDPENLQFVQRGDIFLRKTMIQDVSGACPTTATLRTISVPPGFKHLALISVHYNADASGGTREIDFTHPSASSINPTIATKFTISANSIDVSDMIATPTNTSSQIREEGSSSANRIIVTRGYMDFRGRKNGK